MISFYPGPSQLDPSVKEALQQAFDSGILSQNHRSEPFHRLIAATKAVIRQKLNVPADYDIIFTSSATECWEITAQSLHNGLSCHFYNGAFGEKWANYTQRLGKLIQPVSFDPDTSPFLHNALDANLFCITSNETSNGTQVNDRFYSAIRQQHLDALIAVDATSSLGGVHHDLSLADVWFASVQKCFGLPSGMAIMLVSPRAAARAMQLNAAQHYNDLPFVLENFRRDETHYTPNTLNIFLLHEVLQNRKSIGEVDHQLRQEQQRWADWEKKQDSVQLLTSNPDVQSVTVMCFRARAEVIQHIIKITTEKGLIIGKGYGKWKPDTFRIANFPALQPEHHEQLRDVLNEIVLP